MNRVIQIAQNEVGYLEKSKSAYQKNKNIIYQQKILIGIKDKIFEKDFSITDLMGLAGALGDNLRTNFSIEEIKGIPEAIFPDYAFASNPDNQVLQIVALVIGVIVTLGLGYAVAEVIKRRN